jgi:protein-ribulosamine 3-kinase
LFTKVSVIPLLLHDIHPAPEPVILHGDLWSGNTGIDGKSGQPVVYDPASYFGHNEADLGIMHMFGGELPIKR